MILLAVRGVGKHYGPEPVLEDVCFDVRPGERIAIVGPNGAGKTTLLRILSGQDEPDRGTVDRHRSARIGYLAQQPEFAPGRTVWDEARAALTPVLDLAHEAERLAESISRAGSEDERRRLAHRFDHVHHELQRLDGYHVDHKIERVLAGLGFAPAAWRQPIDQLSGGQQNRLLLARLLLEQPDLMLLDEPSNHLDLEATQWLEQYLCDTSQSLLVVSHDRYFLDKVANRTLELYHGTLDAYEGNFSAYRRQKVERLEVQRRTYDRQQLEIAKMEEFVRRNFYGQKHAQAEDRRKKLERLERVEPPREIQAPPMGFPPAPHCGEIVLRVEHLSKRYDRPLFEDLTFDLLRGEKWGILGPNGCGKTTLLRCLLGRTTPDHGRVVMGTGVRVAYFDQLLDCVSPESEVLEAVRPDNREFHEQQRRDLLARFGVTGEMVFQRVQSLSGGERNRVALALLAAREANVLVLDEPTNHLDLWARAALEKALRTYDGTVLFVSHDRYFMNQVADHLIVVEPGRFRVIEGNYDTYRQLVERGLMGPAAAAPEPAPRTKRSVPSATAPPARRKRQFPYRKVAELEAEIFQREARIEELHQALASPEVLRSGDRVKEASAELEQQHAALAALYQHWDEANELGDR